MPYADPQKQREYMQRYHERRKLDRLVQLRENYRSKVGTKRAKATARNRKNGYSERVHGPQRAARIPINKQRRWVRYGDLIYTNSEIGFTLKDLREMIKTLRDPDYVLK